MFDVPSIMKLFEVGRAPMMLIALPDALAHRALLAVGLDRACAQEQQRQEVAPVEGQVGDLLLGDHLADGGGFGVEGHRGRPAPRPSPSALPAASSRSMRAT